MNRKKAKEEINNIFSIDNILECTDVMNINHRPHPYCITDKHIGKYTTLNDENIRQLEKENGRGMCGMYVSSNGKYTNGRKVGYSRCNLTYDEHTSDTVAVIELGKDINKSIIAKELQKITSILEENKIDGVIFKKNNFNMLD